MVGLGASGLTITQTDTYVVGQESYTTDVQISNANATPRPVRLYAGGDCFLQNSDAGFGRVDGNAVACTTGTAPGSRIEQLYPLTSGSSYMEAGYSTVWAQMGAQAAAPNTCDCATFEDNGIMLSWDVTVPASGSVTVSHLTTFSPLGIVPLSTTKTADSASVDPGAADGYTITIHNSNSDAVVVNTITDTLPAGFTYTPGSTTGATTSDPTVSGQNLTWSGPFNDPAGGDVTLHFGVTVSSTPGTYYNNAGGSAETTAVAQTGDTAPVQVGGPDRRPDAVLHRHSGRKRHSAALEDGLGSRASRLQRLSSEGGASAQGQAQPLARPRKRRSCRRQILVARPECEERRALLAPGREHRRVAQLVRRRTLGGWLTQATRSRYRGFVGARPDSRRSTASGGRWASRSPVTALA